VFGREEGVLSFLERGSHLNSLSDAWEPGIPGKKRVVVSKRGSSYLLQNKENGFLAKKRQRSLTGGKN